MDFFCISYNLSQALFCIRLDSISNNPAGIRRYPSADSREASLGTAWAPGDDSDENVSVVERAPGIALTGVPATHVQQTGADHVFCDNSWARCHVGVALSAERAVDGVDGHVAKDSWCQASLLFDKQIANSTLHIQSRFSEAS